MIKLYFFDEATRAMEEVSGGNFQKPIVVRAVPNGTRGMHKLYIANLDTTKVYTGIGLSISAQQPLTYVQSSSISCKMLSGDAEPTEAEWLAASDTGTLLQSPLDGGVNTNRSRLPNLTAGRNNYYPLWVSVLASAPLRPGDYLYTVDVTYTESQAS